MNIKKSQWIVLFLRLFLAILNIVLKLMGCWAYAQAIVLLLFYPLLGMVTIPWTQASLLCVLTSVYFAIAGIRAKGNRQYMAYSSFWSVSIAALACVFISNHYGARIPVALGIIVFVGFGKKLMEMRFRTKRVKNGKK